jgi:hypothetical protein
MQGRRKTRKTGRVASRGRGRVCEGMRVGARAGMLLAADGRGGSCCDGESLVPDEIERELENAYIEAFNGGTFVGEGSDWGGTVTLTRLDPLLSAGSSAIHSEDLLHRSASSRNHPNPFTSTTTLQFGLPRASSIGLVVYEDTALFAGFLKQSIIT